MAEKKKYANDPLLYIHQPNIGNAQAPMQHSYMSSRKKAKQESSAADEVVTVPKKVRRQAPFQQGLKTEEPHNIKDKEEAPKRKNFKEMDIPEKIDYFLKRPDFAPQVRCEIKTNGKNYRGIVTSFEENNVFIKPTNRKTVVQIAMDEISDVQLLGF